MKTLIAFSGGLDSTYLLWRLLIMTDDQVHAFWMDLGDITYVDKDGKPVRYYHDLLPAEKIVFPRVLQWFHDNVRPVSAEVRINIRYEPEPEDCPKGTSRSWRVIPMLKVAAEIVKRDGMDRFVYGRSPENIRSLGKEWQAARMAWYQKWWAENAPGTAFQMPLLDIWHGRPHALVHLPPSLQALMLTCNNPTIVDGEPVSCETCDKCELTHTSRELLNLMCTPDVVLDYLLRKRKAGPYIDALGTPDPKFGGGIQPSKFPPYSDEEKKR